MRYCLAKLPGTALLVAIVSCGGDATSPAPSTGSIQVDVSTTGPRLDPDGYTIILADSLQRAARINDTILWVNLSPRSYILRLDGVANNCSVVQPNPQTVTLANGDTTAATFDVVCRDGSSPSGLPLVISPRSTAAGSQDLVLTIEGSGFVGSHVFWSSAGDTTRLESNYISGTRLTANVPAALLSKPAEAQVFVETGDLMGDLPLKNTAPATFQITDPAGGPVAKIVIATPPISLGVGETALLHAWADGAVFGRIRPPAPITWSTTDSTLGKVAPGNGEGVSDVDFWATLKGLRPGVLTIHASTGGVSTVARITLGEPATSFEVSPTAMTLNASTCQRGHLSMTLRDQTGTVLFGRQPVWSSSNPLVANVGQQSGLITALSAGTATVTGTTGRISASVAITVTGHIPGRFGCDDE